jgi:hypothetical protein
VAGAAEAGTGAAVAGVAATDTEVDSTEIGAFTQLATTGSTVAGAGSAAAIFPGGSRFQFRFPIRGTADTVTDTAGGQAMGTGILVQAMATAAETQIKATQNRARSACYSPAMYRMKSSSVQIKP